MIFTADAPTEKQTFVIVKKNNALRLLVASRGSVPRRDGCEDAEES
jgi:hypothetical protein